MRVLVTGAFGYVGLALVRRLAAEHDVVALGHPPRTAEARAAIPPRVETIEADILDLGAAALGALDAVVHLAAVGPGADPTLAVRTNVLGSQLVLDAGRAAGARRMILASTVAVYGGRQRRSAAPLRETDATGADGPHAATKEAAERSWTAQGGIALRLARLYGAGVGLGGDAALAGLARAAAAGGDLPIAAGAGKVDCLEIDDAVEAFARALGAAGPPPVLNVGSGTPIRLGEFATACVAAAHKLGRSPRIVAAEAAAPAPPDPNVAVGLAVATLGWQPRRKLLPSVEALVARLARAEAA